MADSCWGTDIQELDPGPFGLGFIKAGIDASGSVIAVWTRSGDYQRVMARRFTETDGWADEVEIGPPDLPIIGLGLSLSVSSSGRAVVAWSTGVMVPPGILVGTNLWSNVYETDGWIGVETIDSGDAQHQPPQVAMDSLGNAMVVWGKSDSSPIGVVSIRHIPGSGWTEPQSVFSDPDFNALPGNVAAGPAGTYVCTVSCNEQSYATRFIDGEWETPHAFEQFDGGTLGGMCAVDSSGRMTMFGRFSTWAGLDRLVYARFE